MCDGDGDNGTIVVTENVKWDGSTVEEAEGQEGLAEGIEEDTIINLSYDFVGIYSYSTYYTFLDWCQF